MIWQQVFLAYYFLGENKVGNLKAWQNFLKICFLEIFTWKKRADFSDTNLISYSILY